MFIDNNINEIKDHIKKVIKSETDAKDIEILVNSYKNIISPLIIDDSNTTNVSGKICYDSGIDDGIRLVKIILAKDLKEFETIRDGLNNDVLYLQDSIYKKVNQAIIDYIKRLVERLDNRNKC